MTCRCSEFEPIELGLQAVFKRIRESRGLSVFLRLVARDEENRRELWRCPACGEAWQSGRVWSYGGQHLFRVPPLAVEDWRREPYIDPAEMVNFASWLQTFVQNLKPQDQSHKLCATLGCSGAALSLSLFCPCHHIAMLQRAGVLSSPPSGRLFAPYEWADDMMQYLERATQRKYLPNPPSSV